MEKLRLKQKAWGINWDKIDEGAYYLGNIDIVYAQTRGKAKSLLLPDIIDYKLYKTGEYVEFTTIPIIRVKEADKYDFNGEILTIWKYDEVNIERKRIKELDDLLNNDSIKYYYIRKGNYYKPNYCGYTDFKHRAGVYSKEEAVSSAKSCRDIWLEKIDIQEHNKMIENEIEELRTSILKL